MDLTRRSLLRGSVGTLGVSALAGCLSEFEEADESEGGSGYAAFFALWDWAENVGGEHFGFENPVDVGEMGHGWEPEGALARDIAGTDAFVYLDTPEFGWAQDIAGQLEADYDDVAIIDGMMGLEGNLLPFDGDSESEELPEPDTNHKFDPDEVEVVGLDIIDLRTDEVVAYWHVDHWDGGLPEIPVYGSVSLGALFEDSEGRVLPLGENELFQFNAVPTEGAQEGIVEIDTGDDYVELSGEEVGRTQLIFELLSDGEVLWDTSEDNLAVTVVEEVGKDETQEFYDPHVWLDPILVEDIVSTIASRLTEIDPDNADTYEENAAAYNEQLSEINAQFEEMIDDSDRDVGVLAGHDSFQYLEHRYGFELQTPVGISPDESPSSQDIADIIEFVEENRIDVILYDHFESPNLAETIVENSSASEVESVSPAEGTTQEWDNEGWGWVEQMEEINIPAFRRALGAE